MINQELDTHTSPWKKYTFATEEQAAKFRVRLFANCIKFTYPVLEKPNTFYCSHRLEDCEDHYLAVMEEFNV